MPRAHVFQAATTLYHPAEGSRVFPAGETDPGDAWTESPGGKPADKGTTKQALLDLIAAQDQIDALGAQLSSKDHDLAVMASERSEALAKVADLEQRALAAEKGQTEADERAAVYMRERDVAREDFHRVSNQVTAANIEIETLKAEVAKFDGDGDGSVGGGKPAAAPAEPADGKAHADWRELHWKQRVALAKSLGAEGDLDAAHADTFLIGAVG